MKASTGGVELPTQRYVPITVEEVLQHSKDLTAAKRLVLIQPCDIDGDEDDGQSVVFGPPSGKFRFRSVLRNALEQIRNLEAFAARDLPLEDEQLSLGLCRTLVAVGLARIT